jgi:hypothetical protein
MLNHPKSLRNEDNSLVSEQKPYFLCMDSTDVPNPHNISRNEAMHHVEDPPTNPTGICIGYDALACNNIYYRDLTESNLVYPCAWNYTTQKCGVDPKNNPELGKDTGYPVDSITIGKNDAGKKNWDTSCYNLMGDPNCLYNNTSCADTATTDVYDALKCWVGRDGIPYTSNSNLMSESEREERTIPLAYGECSWDGSNCVPEDCGCGGWYNEARWRGGSKNCGNGLRCVPNSICQK